VVAVLNGRDAPTEGMALLRFEGGGAIQRAYTRLQEVAWMAAEVVRRRSGGRGTVPDLMAGCLLLWHVYLTDDQDQAEKVVADLLAPSPREIGVLCPSCAVCLHRLDGAVTGLVASPCTHPLQDPCHCWALRGPSRACPVCRAVREHVAVAASLPSAIAPSPEEDYQPGGGVDGKATPCHSHACAVCQVQEHLWACLICGYIGCGRYTREHSLRHFEETQHRWALQLATGRIWDYDEDTFAHRLPGAAQAPLEDQRTEVMGMRFAGIGAGGGLTGLADASGSGGGGGGSSGSGGSSGGVGGKLSMRPGEEQDLVALKLSGLTSEYEHLLLSQLEEQRRYFEQLLAKEEAEMLSAAVANADMSAELQEQIDVLKTSILGREEEHRTIMARLREDEATLRQERKKNAKLLAIQRQKEAGVAAINEQVSQEAKSCDEHVEELKQQIMELSFYLRTQHKVTQSPQKQELQQGHVLVGEANPPDKSRGGSSTRRNSGGTGSSGRGGRN